MKAAGKFLNYVLELEAENKQLKHQLCLAYELAETIAKGVSKDMLQIVKNGNLD